MVDFFGEVSSGNQLIDGLFGKFPPIFGRIPRKAGRSKQGRAKAAAEPPEAPIWRGAAAGPGGTESAAQRAAGAGRLSEKELDLEIPDRLYRTVKSDA
jgi:hypothetical protein